MAIGLNGAVCMYLNCMAYLNESLEFHFYAIHECTHVIYERCHKIPSLADVDTPTEWRSYSNLWVQNEGFAVYAPLRLREKLGHLDEPDYCVLLDLSQLEISRLAFLHILKSLQSDVPLTQEEYLEACFDDMRLTYRLGCELIRCIERISDAASVRKVFFFDGDEFLEHYQHLLMD